MHGITIGQRYLFKTIAHYYAGIVKSINDGFVTLIDKPELVLWTGQWPKAADGKRWEKSYVLPERTMVAINSLVAIIPLDQ